MSESLEHHEHAAHAAEHGNKRAALIIAVLAAALAICEQQVKHAEIGVSQSSILAADAWNQYQAKSIRAAIAQDLAGLARTLDAPAGADRAAARDKLLRQLADDQARYETDEQNGKGAVSERAREFERERDHDLHRAHIYDNASAALQLGIVLATASVITASRLLLRFALLLGAAGLGFGVLGAVAPAALPF